MSGVNNNKQITQADLQQFKIGSKISQQTSDTQKSIFKMIDRDGDGEIEKGEYEGVVTAKFKDKDGKPIERQMIKLKSLEKGRSLCVDQYGKQWVVAHDGTVLNDKYVENPKQFKADAEYNQKVETREAADKHAEEFYTIADDNDGLVGKSVTKMKKYWDKNINSKNVIQMLDSYQSYLEKNGKDDSSIIDTITSEVGASAAEQRVMLTTIIQTLCKAAREAGVSEGDIQKAYNDFMNSMNTELNATTRRTNPKDMEKAIDFLRGAIIAKQNGGGEITDKEAIETVSKDFNAENDKAQKDFKDAREEEGWAASIGDTVCGWFGCNTVEELEEKLGVNAAAAKRLASAKSIEEFKIIYKEIFGIEFDKNKIAAREVALGKYQQANAMNVTIKITDEILANANSKDYAKLRAEIKEKFKIDDKIVDQIIANYAAVSGKEIKTEADKREMLLKFLNETKAASQAEFQKLTNGKTLDQMGKDLELLHKSAFGTSDIAKDVAQFNQNMVVTEMVTECAFEVAGTIALQFVPGLGQMAAAKLAVSAAKWGTKAVKVANAAAKAEKAFATAAKVQQGAGMSSKVASTAAKTGSSMAAAGVATATVGLTNGDDVKAVMKKTLMNMSFAGAGVGASELASKLVKAFGISSELAKELAEEIINAAAAYGITKVSGDDYGSSDAFIDLATGIVMARLGHIKGGVPDANAPKSAAPNPAADANTKPQAETKPKSQTESKSQADATGKTSSGKKAYVPPKAQEAELVYSDDIACNSDSTPDVNAPKSGDNVSKGILSSDDMAIIEKRVKNPEYRPAVSEALEEIGARVCNGEAPSKAMLNDVADKLAAKYNIDPDNLKDYIENTMSNMDKDWQQVWDCIDTYPTAKRAQADGVDDYLESFRDKGLSSSELQAKQEAELKAQQEAELKAQQEAELKAQQEAEFKAQQEAELKAQQEAEVKAQQEAEQKRQEILEAHKDKYPEVINAQFRDEESSVKLIALMNEYDPANMSYDNFNPQELYSKIYNAGITNEHDIDVAFNIIKKRFHANVIAEETRIKSLKDKFKFRDVESIKSSDEIIAIIKQKQANGEKISMEQIEGLIADKCNNQFDYNAVKERVLAEPELKEYLESNLHLSLVSNEKYSNALDGNTEAIMQVGDAVNKLKAQAASGNKITLETIEEVARTFTSTEQYWVLQDILRKDPDLAPLCKDFVEEIVKDGFDP